MNLTIILAAALALAAAPGLADSTSAATATTNGAEIKTRTITYSDDAGNEYKGFFAWDDAIEGPRPAVLIVHAWWGLGENEKKRARMLAQLGYAAFALDMYGQGKLTADPAVAGKWAGAVGSDRDHARSIARLGLDTMARQPEVDPEKMAGIGYCFGGTQVLELAYSGARLRGIVSFHGNPRPARPEDVSKIRAGLLLCHGAADTLVPQSTIDAFTRALEGSDVDWQIHTYAHAKHSFTTPDADGLGMNGVGYNEKADKRSWQAMKDFFSEIFD